MSDSFDMKDLGGFGLSTRPQAKQEQIALLKEQGVTAWNDWKKEREQELEKENGRSVEKRWSKPEEPKQEKKSLLMGMRQEREEVFDLRRADLSGLDLTGVDFRGTYLVGANLEQTNLTDANLAYACLASARLNKANLSNANLTHASLSRASLDDATLAHADLTYANLSVATVYRAKLAHADFTYADISSANFTDADLSNADLADAVADKTKFDGARKTNAKMPGSDSPRKQAKRAEVINALKQLKKGTNIVVNYVVTVHATGKHPYEAQGAYQGIEGDEIVLSVLKVSAGEYVITEGYGSQPFFQGGGKVYFEEKRIPLYQMTEWMTTEERLRKAEEQLRGPYIIMD